VAAYLASRAGVGLSAGQLVQALLAAASKGKGDRFRLCAASARSDSDRRLREAFRPFGGEIRLRKIPMRLLVPVVDKCAWPNLETLFGPMDVFHAGPLLVPHAINAALVVTVYDITPIRFPHFHLASNRFTAAQLRRRLARADLVIVPSINTRKDLETLGVPQEKVRTVPLGVSRSFRPLLQQDGRDVLRAIGLDREYLLAVGSLEPRKNLLRLLQAFRHLKDRCGIPHKLAVVGPRGWMDQAIYGSVQRLRLSDSVVFTGFVDEEVLNLLYNYATVLVYPSLYEGFGLPPLEAMAAGCPVVVSRVSSLPEVVGDAGLYFDPTDVDDIAGTVQRILESPELRSRLADLGRSRSREFSWEKTATATRMVYSEAIEIRRQNLT